MELNEARREEAEGRIIAAAARLRLRGEPVTATAVAKEAGAPKATVGKVLGTPVHTPRNTSLYKGMNRVPQIPEGAGKADDSEGLLEAVMMSPKDKAGDEDRLPMLKRDERDLNSMTDMVEVEPVGLSASVDPHPFIEAVGGDDTPSVSEGIPKRQLLVNRLRPGVYLAEHPSGAEPSLIWLGEVRFGKSEEPKGQAGGLKASLLVYLAGGLC